MARPRSPDLIEVQAGAFLAGVSPQTIRRWCRKFAIGRKVGGRHLVSRSRLAELLAIPGDCDDKKKDAQKQQEQQGNVSAGLSRAYGQQDPAIEADDMLSVADLPPRRVPNIETVSASLPYGARERIKAAAAAERMTAGDFLRRTILQAVAPDLLPCEVATNGRS